MLIFLWSEMFLAGFVRFTFIVKKQEKMLGRQRDLNNLSLCCLLSTKAPSVIQPVKVMQKNIQLVSAMYTVY